MDTDALVDKLRSFQKNDDGTDPLKTEIIELLLKQKDMKPCQKSCTQNQKLLNFFISREFGERIGSEQLPDPELEQKGDSSEQQYNKEVGCQCTLLEPEKTEITECPHIYKKEFRKSAMCKWCYYQKFFGKSAQVNKNDEVEDTTMSCND